MEPGTTDLFYSRLPVNELSISDLLAEEHLFFKVPDSWYVIITDVKNSTKAAAEGRHQTVNLVATGSIVAALNVAYKANITIPFFFGGDGATFIIPPSLLDSAITALVQHRENTLNTFGLDLRVGHLPVNDIYSRQHELKITKLKASHIFNIPIVLGTGLTYAEKIIKSNTEPLPASLQAKTEELDMSGMHCRWDKVNPPANGFEVISLLVVARESRSQPAAFKQVMNIIDNIYGEVAKRKPISVDKLRMIATLQKVGTEMRTRFGKFNLLYLLKTWVTTLLGKVYFKTKKGKEYLYKLVDMADTLVIDGRINTVITGTAAQRENLTSELDKLENNGEILYGMHISKASVMSCYVRNLENEHIHFVDGDDGGYTKAATVLKQKMALSPSSI